MVHRLTHEGEEAAGTMEGRKRESTATRRRRRRQGGGDAIAAIKRRMLRCSEAGERVRFKRSYLAGAGGGEQGDGASAVFFYLACIACAPA
ncbi:unnamed protein product [Triticum turgidum subsp. durum]|uniref:Uncharacterized protein n=1 Tax=Triticum turgidum subsp. durum TaxID=4567 RepID=A0A9R1C0V3_TRITD|nr:unnamed protein product [Triticum turgidum subsp. durum]